MWLVCLQSADTMSTAIKTIKADAETHQMLKDIKREFGVSHQVALREALERFRKECAKAGGVVLRRRPAAVGRLQRRPAK